MMFRRATKGMSKMYDSIKMRGAIRSACQRNGRLECAWCVGNIAAGFDPHHALVKRSQCSHAAIHSEYNIVPLHRECHAEHGQSAEMTVKALDYLIDRLGAERIARWYISLWRDHGLSVAQGVVPLCEHIATEDEWREYLELVILPLCFAA